MLILYHFICRFYCVNKRMLIKRAMDGINIFARLPQKDFLGGAGYRSRYLSHAKRALYHLSYAPDM
jgi:hypothetical protein